MKLGETGSTPASRQIAETYSAVLEDGQRFSRGAIKRIERAEQAGVSQETIEAYVFNAGMAMAHKEKVGPFQSGAAAFEGLQEETTAAITERFSHAPVPRIEPSIHIYTLEDYKDFKE